MGRSGDSLGDGEEWRWGRSRDWEMGRSSDRGMREGDRGIKQGWPGGTRKGKWEEIHVGVVTNVVYQRCQFSIKWIFFFVFFCQSFHSLVS